MYSGIKGPSDIFVDHHSKTIWIPAINENKLVAVFLKDVVNKAREKN